MIKHKVGLRSRVQKPLFVFVGESCRFADDALTVYLFTNIPPNQSTPYLVARSWHFYRNELVQVVLPKCRFYTYLQGFIVRNDVADI